MKKGDIVIFVDKKYHAGGAFTINKKYLVKDSGRVKVKKKFHCFKKNKYKYVYWIVTEDDTDEVWEISADCFKTIDEFRDFQLYNIGI
jgi:hypothetical protein